MIWNISTMLGMGQIVISSLAAASAAGYLPVSSTWSAVLIAVAAAMSGAHKLSHSVQDAT